MVKGRVIFEDEGSEKVILKYPCFELKDIVEYYFEIKILGNSINPFSIVALPNVNIVASIHLTRKSQSFKVHRELGISNTSGDKLCGGLTEAITVIHAPGTHEFAIKFKPGVLHSCLIGDSSKLIDSHIPLSKYIEQGVIDELKSKESFAGRVEFAENWLLNNIQLSKTDFRFDTVSKAMYYINSCKDYKISAVSKQVGVSNATLNRYFKEILGVSPKQSFKALRFKTALKNYRSVGSSDLYDELGYTDFSHFVKEAKSLANKTPSEL